MRQYIVLKRYPRTRSIGVRGEAISCLGLLNDAQDPTLAFLYGDLAAGDGFVDQPFFHPVLITWAITVCHPVPGRGQIVAEEAVSRMTTGAVAILILWAASLPTANRTKRIPSDYHYSHLLSQNLFFPLKVHEISSASTESHCTI